MGRLIAVVLCLMLVGCESDVDKLNRLTQEEAIESLLVANHAGKARALADSLGGTPSGLCTDPQCDRYFEAVLARREAINRRDIIRRDIRRLTR
jgi:hypothetical protein